MGVSYIIWPDYRIRLDECYNAACNWLELLLLNCFDDVEGYWGLQADGLSFV